MRNKILYRTTNLWNILLFITISLIFFLIQQSAYLSLSILDKSFLIQSLKSYPLILTLYLFLGIATYNLMKASRYLFLVLFVLQTAIIVLNLFEDFSKLIVVTTGVQIIFSYYFYNFLKLELMGAGYNTTVSEHNLFENPWKRIVLLKNNLDVGYLTNWDENGFNVYFTNLELEGDFKHWTLRFENKTFDIELRPCWRSHDKRKMGFLVVNNEDKSSHVFNWNDLYCTLLNMGFEMGYIK